MIEFDDLVDRGVYHVRSRNLSVGVWDASVKGFTGIREKFGSEFLDTEYHWDTGGTARAETYIAQLPSHIEVVETMPTVCDTCEKTVGFDITRPEGTRWRHHDLTDDHKVFPVARTYKPLFDYLKEVS